MAALRTRAATGGAAMKKRGRETTKLKGRNALPVTRHRGPTAADLQKQLDQRTRELADAQKHLAEALEQQTAISDILRVISSSPSDVQPVLDSVAEHAARICEAQVVDVIIAEENKLRVGASLGDLERPADATPLDR